MKRFFLSGAVALVLALPALLAQPKPKSQAELDALKVMFGAQTPDARIAACENVLTKFADTEFKAVALYFEGLSYEQKGDYRQHHRVRRAHPRGGPQALPGHADAGHRDCAAHQGIRPGPRGQTGAGGEVR